jgi:hypothetical protein
MSFPSWCAYRASTLRTQLAAQLYTYERRLMVAEAQAASDRRLAAWMSTIGRGIARDIREWRVEA